MCQISIILGVSDFETNLGLKEGELFRKIIFDIKIVVGIFEILNMPNFNKF